MIYYRTQHPEVLAAWEGRTAALKRILAAGKAFAEEFGGQMMWRNDLIRSEVTGLRFSPVLVDPLWTKPDPKTRMQRPRYSTKGIAKELRPALEELQKRYQEAFPKERYEADDWLKTVGLDWGQLIFGSGLGAFDHDGWLYIKTGASGVDRSRLQEIRGSEWMAAKEAKDDEKQAGKAA